MQRSAFHAGREYARYHNTRPLIGALVRGRGWTLPYARQFLAGYDAATFAREAWREPIKSRTCDLAPHTMVFAPQNISAT